jgi:hypothetical protein
MRGSAAETRQYRSFGLLVGGIFGLIGLWPALFRSQNPRLWVILIAGLLVLSAVIVPRSLAPVHRVWMAAGEILGWINSRIILGLVFYGLLTPIGLTLRLFRRDPLSLRFDPHANSYRVPRQTRSGSHMTHQY